MTQSMLNGYLQPEEAYSSYENPDGLNERIRAAGYNPDAFMMQDGAIPVLAYIIVDGERVAKIEPSRNRGRFGGWQIVPIAGMEKIGILTRWEMPAKYTIKWEV